MLSPMPRSQDTVAPTSKLGLGLSIEPIFGTQMLVPMTCELPIRRDMSRYWYIRIFASLLKLPPLLFAIFAEQYASWAQKAGKQLATRNRAEKARPLLGDQQERTGHPQVASQPPKVPRAVAAGTVFLAGALAEGQPGRLLQSAA